MYALYKKEIAGFFSSLTGYVVIFIFLLSIGTFMWLVPGNNNVLDNGYASLNTFFMFAPWVFMFLLPAIAMRLFSEEQKSGTIELLLTRPISELEIVIAKYLSALTIAIISILPTFIYFFSVYRLGNPMGNIDIGGTWGSYIGLFFLAASYAAIGVWCSSLSSNQVIAFIITVAVIFVFYFGFESLSAIFINTKAEYIIQSLSMDRHYQSMSRGVIDTRDLVYFLAVIIIFIQLTKIKLQSRRW
ncbi:MAG: gliding motility-associated ABC transporter permease subunit GldF [Salinivirgaceae bacterium]|nr:gliding motility-associated ABC transporter permease subunit GldF [Salinivirgaceae bacterium]